MTNLALGYLPFLLSLVRNPDDKNGDGAGQTGVNTRHGFGPPRRVGNKEGRDHTSFRGCREYLLRKALLHIRLERTYRMFAENVPDDIEQWRQVSVNEQSDWRWATRYRDTIRRFPLADHSRFFSS